MLHRAEGEEIRWKGEANVETTIDDTKIFPALGDALEKFTAKEVTLPIVNADRSVGARLSGRIALAKGQDGLPEETFRVRFQGVAGQSFGAFLMKGVTFRLEGEANDYVGKGLSGGRIVIVPRDGDGCAPEENVIAGNVIGYGGTSGSIFIKMPPVFLPVPEDSARLRAVSGLEMLLEKLLQLFFLGGTLLD